MGFWKDIANAAVGVVNDVAGTNMSVGKSDSGGGSSDNNSAAATKAIKERTEQLYQALIAKGMDATVARINAEMGAKSWAESAEGKKVIALIEANLNNGSPVDGSVIKNILNSAIDTAKGAINNKVTGIIDKAGGALLNKPILKGAIPISQTLGKIGEQSLQETVKQFLKKHWYWLLIPFGFVGALLYVTIKSGRKVGKRSSKNRF